MSPLVFGKASTFLFLPLGLKKAHWHFFALFVYFCSAGKCLFSTDLFVPSPRELGNPSQALLWLLNVSRPLMAFLRPHSAWRRSLMV